MGTMPGAKPISIDGTRRDLASADPHVRGRALNALLMAIDRQPELREPARQIFHESAEHETYNWLVTTSVTGIERLDGPDTARPYWRRLLTQPDATAAGQAAMAVVNPSHLPLMLEMFDARAEFAFRRGAIYAFGRMRDPSVIPLLLKLGEDEQMQPCIVQALSDLGDPSAIPWLQALVPSNRHLPELDERGAQWTLGDIAAQAIRQIERRAGRPSSFQPAMAHVPMPPPLPGRQAWQPRRPNSVRQFWSLVHPSLIPLCCAAAEIVWLLSLFALYIFMVGDQRPTFTVPTRLADGLALPLPMIGVLAAILVFVARRTPRPWHKVVAIVGGLICGLFVVMFGSEFITG